MECRTGGRVEIQSLVKEEGLKDALGAGFVFAIRARFSKL